MAYSNMFNLVNNFIIIISFNLAKKDLTVDTVYAPFRVRVLIAQCTSTAARPSVRLYVCSNL